MRLHVAWRAKNVALSDLIYNGGHAVTVAARNREFLGQGVAMMEMKFPGVAVGATTGTPRQSFVSVDKFSE
jgi:hypothetical protein